MSIPTYFSRSHEYGLAVKPDECEAFGITLLSDNPKAMREQIKTRYGHLLLSLARCFNLILILSGNTHTHAHTHRHTHTHKHALKEGGRVSAFAHKLSRRVPTLPSGRYVERVVLGLRRAASPQRQEGTVKEGGVPIHRIKALPPASRFLAPDRRPQPP